MSQSSLTSVQIAVYSALIADSTLEILLGGSGRILDAIPEPNKLAVYVALAESIETPQDTFGSYGNVEVLTIKIVVEDTQAGSGWKRAKDIDARIVALLDGPDLTVGGRSFIYCTRDLAQTIHDPPWRVISRDFRIATEDPNS